MQILNSCKYGDQKSHKREVYFVTDTAVDWVDIIKEEWEMRDEEWLFQSEIKIYSWKSGKVDKTEHADHPNSVLVNAI